jgi:hypothetical protein
MKGKPKLKYSKPVSLYPSRPKEAISAFMKIDPKRVRELKSD